MEDSGVWGSLMPHLSQDFPKQWSCYCEKRNIVISITIQLWCRFSFLEFCLDCSGSYWDTNLVSSWFHFLKLFRSGSGLWIEVSLNADVCDFTSFFCFISGVCVFSLFSSAKYVKKLAILNFPRMSPVLLPDNLRDWDCWEYCSGGIRSVNHNSGVNTWNL